MDDWLPFLLPILVGFIIIIGFLGASVYKQQLNQELDVCAKTNNVFECEWIAVPKKAMKL